MDAAAAAAAAAQCDTATEGLLALLRQYLTATTAKDCAAMVCLQQLAPAQLHDPICCLDYGHNQRQHQQPFTSAASSTNRTTGVLVDASSNACFAYAVALIDTDAKPLAKLWRHAELERDIQRAAAAHADLLAAHVHECRAWMAMWSEARTGGGSVA